MKNANHITLDYKFFLPCFRRVVFLFFFIVIPNEVFSQNSARRFENISQKYQQIHFGVNAITQDSLGFIWFGTDAGLFRFDGYELRGFLHDVLDSTSLSSPTVNDIIVDKSDRIWASTNYGINLLDRGTGTFKRFTPFKEGRSTKGLNNIIHLFVDSKNRLWSTGNRNLYLFDEEKEQLVQISSRDSLNNRHSIRVFTEDADGKLWCGTSQGLLQINPDSLFFDYYPLDQEGNPGYNNIYDMEIGSDGKFWTVTEAGLALLNPYSISYDYIKLDHALLKLPIRKITTDRNGRLWLGFNKNGVAEYNPAQNTFFHYIHDDNNIYSLLNDDVQNLFEDREGNMWLATNQGIAKSSSREAGLKHYKNVNGEGLVANQTLRILKDYENQLWVKTPDGLFVKQDESAFAEKSISFPNIDSRFIGDWLYEHSDHSIWIPVTGKGIFRKISNDKRFNLLPLDPLLRKTFIYKIIPDIKDPDILWIGTSDGLCRLNAKTYKSTWYQPEGKIPGLSTNRLPIFDQYGDDIWLYYTFFNSLGRFSKSKESFESFRPPPEKQYVLEGTIRDIAVSPEGNVWLASSYGLTNYNIKDDNYLIYSNKDGLERSNLSAVLVDKNNDIWVTGEQFVSRFDRKKGIFENFNATGIIKSFVSKSKFISDEGEIYFGGLNGLVVFQPDSILQDVIAPTVVLTDFKVQDSTFLLPEAVEYIDEIVLSHKQNDLVFQFAGIQFKDASAIHYRCLLEGYDEKWRQLGTSNVVNYTNLNPAHYVLRVQSGIGGTIWNSKGLSVGVLIQPPFFQTNWFRTLLALFFIILIYSVYKVWHYQQELRRQKEMALQASEFRSKFLAHASHEIRTPMNAIIGLSGLMKESPLTNKQSDYIIAIEKASQNLLKIINELLDHSKIESGKFSYQKDPFSPVMIIDQLDVMMRPLAVQKSLEFHVSIHDEVPNELIGDGVRLTQILTNLVGNALKFTEEGSVKLSVECIKRESENIWLEFRIRDTGKGISPDKLDTVFEQFSSDQRSFGLGSGLGLFITRELVEGQGGEISIESQVNSGTTVFCQLPFEPAGKATVNKDIIADSYNFDRVRILLVDDTPFNHMVASEMIKSRIPDAEIIKAFDGQEALDVLNETEVDLVIMDVKMPGMDGLEATGIIRRSQNWMKEVPILGATAGAMTEQVEACLEIGMDDVITKPIKSSELLQKMHNLLKRNHD